MPFTPWGRFFSFVKVKKSDIKLVVRADIPGDNRHKGNFIRKCLCLTEKAIQGMKLSNIHSIKTSRERKKGCLPFSCCVLKKKKNILTKWDRAVSSFFGGRQILTTRIHQVIKSNSNHFGVEGVIYD